MEGINSTKREPLEEGAVGCGEAGVRIGTSGVQIDRCCAWVAVARVSVERLC